GAGPGQGRHRRGTAAPHRRRRPPGDRGFPGGRPTAAAPRRPMTAAGAPLPTANIPPKSFGFRIWPPAPAAVLPFRALSVMLKSKTIERKGGQMFLRIDKLQIELPQNREPDPNAAAAVQELLGGRFGEMSTLMNYMYQSFNFRGR